MRHYVAGAACLLIFSACLRAAALHGKVTDPSGKPIADAQVSIVTRLGVEAQTITGADGTFSLPDPGAQDERIVVNAAGFSTLALEPAAGIEAKLQIAPQTDSVRVVGSAIDAPATLDRRGACSALLSWIERGACRKERAMLVPGGLRSTGRRRARAPVARATVSLSRSGACWAMGIGRV